MKKTKDKILAAALKLFNKQGVAGVSIRQIAKETGISHGNLIYHFRNKEEIIQGLHAQLLEHAIKINSKIDRVNFDISGLYDATYNGFNVVYDFRFMFFDLLYIVNTDPLMRTSLMEVEKIRSAMYSEVIALSIDHGLMRKGEYSGEYEELIKRIKIYSDHWITSAAIYEKLKKDALIREYANLFMGHFYPYLTVKGKRRLKNKAH